MSLLEAPKIDAGISQYEVASFRHLHNRALLLAEVLSESWHPQDERAILAEELDFTVSGLSNLLIMPRGQRQLAVDLPAGTAEHPGRLRSLIDDYRTGTSNEDLRLQIPIGKIHRAGGLAGGYLEAHSYNPVLDLQISTEADRPLSIFDIEAGGITEQPSPGQWYRFPLGLVNMRLESVAAE